MDFASMMSGGSPSGSSSTSDIVGLISGLADTAAPIRAIGSGSTSVGGLRSLVGGVGSAVGNAVLPGIGGAAGGLLGDLIGGLFGTEHVPDGAGAFNGLHSPTLSSLDDSKWFKEDAAIFVGFAKQLGISVEEVGIGYAADAIQTNHSPAYVFDAYRGQDAESLWNRISAYNKDNPGAVIQRNVLGPEKVTVDSVKCLVDWHGSPSIISLMPRSTSQPVQQVQQSTPAASVPLGGGANNVLQTLLPIFSAVTGNANGGASSTPLLSLPSVASFNNATSQAADKGSLLEELIKAMTAGAKNGAVDVLADTDAAKAAKADYFKDFVSTYQLPLAAGGVGLLLLIKKAFFDNPNG